MSGMENGECRFLRTKDMPLRAPENVRLKLILLLSKAKALLWRLHPGDKRITVFLTIIGGHVSLIIIWEVVFQNIERLAVNLHIVMSLQVMDGDHATGIFHENRIFIVSTRPSSQSILLPNFQNIIDGVQGDLDGFVVHHRQQVAQGLDATLLNEVPDLLGFLKTTRCGIRNGPASLLPSLEVGRVGQDVDERWYQVCFDDRLNLNWRSSSNV